MLGITLFHSFLHRQYPYNAAMMTFKPLTSMRKTSIASFSFNLTSHSLYHAVPFSHRGICRHSFMAVVQGMPPSCPRSVIIMKNCLSRTLFCQINNISRFSILLPRFFKYLHCIIDCILTKMAIPLRLTYSEMAYHFLYFIETYSVLLKTACKSVP